MGFFRKRVKLKRLKKAKINLEETLEYEYCKIFIEFCEALSHAGGNDSKVTLIWNHEKKTLSYKINGSKAFVERIYPNTVYYVYKRLTEEIKVYKDCKVEKRLYL